MSRPLQLPPVVSRDPAQRRFFETLKEIIEIGEGVRGNDLDRKLTLRDLVDSGVVEYARRQGNFDASKSIRPAGGERDPTIPPRPTGFDVLPGISFVYLDWRPPAYSNHAYANVYRSEEDNFANATIISQAPGATYMDYVPYEVVNEETGELKGYYYWITYVSVSDIEGPPNSAAGTFGAPTQEADYFLNRIIGLIGEQHLETGLLGKVNADLEIDTLRFEQLESILSRASDRLASIEGRINFTTTGRSIEQVADRVDQFNSTLQARIGQVQFDISGVATQTLGTTTRVDELTGQITSLSSFVTELESDLRSADGSISANAAATEGLQTRITANENEIESISTKQVALTARVTNAETGISGNAGALSQLETRVTQNENGITAVSTDVVNLEARVEDNENNISGQANASQALEARVTQNENGIESNSVSITALSSRVDNNELGISGNASAINLIETRVTQTESGVEANSTSITQLDARISANDGDISANANSIQLVENRVTQTENSIGANSTAITQLQSRVTDAEQGVSANAQATQSLDTRVTSNEQGIQSNASRLDELEASTTNERAEANAQAIDALTVRVTQNESDISAESTRTTNLTTRVTNAETGISGNSSSIQSLQTSVQQNSDGIQANSVQITSLSSRVDDTEAGVSGNATAIDGVRTRVTQNENDINAFSVRVTELESDVTSLESGVNGNANAISGLTTEVNQNKDGITANSNAVTSLQSRVTDAEGNIQGNATATQSLSTRVDTFDGRINKVEAEFVVKLDANGNAAGFGLATSSKAYSPGVHSKATFSVDQFSIVKPGNQQLQFLVENGKVVMDGAFIKNATITSAQIGELTATKISAGTITAAVELKAASITGGSLSINNKFTVDASGNVLIRNASTGARLEVRNDVIKVFDTNGTLRVRLGNLAA